MKKFIIGIVAILLSLSIAVIMIIGRLAERSASPSITTAGTVMSSGNGLSVPPPNYTTGPGDHRPGTDLDGPGTGTRDHRQPVFCL